MKHYLLIAASVIVATFVTTGAAAEPQSATASRLILVSGVTGQQGGAVARELLKRGYPVRGLTRNPNSDRAKEMAALGVELVKGDFDDSASLDAALAGVYGAFSMQNWREAGPDGEIRQGKAFADAAKRTGVKHFVYSSVATAGKKVGLAPFDSKYEIEQHIREIGLPYTVIRPTSFMTNFYRYRDNILAGTYRSPMPPDKKSQYIAVSDIGKFAAEAFDNPDKWLGRAIVIAGDEKTNAEVAEIFSRVLGKPVKYEQTPWDEFTASVPPPVVEMVRYFRDTGYDVEVAALRKEFPWMLTLEEYLMQSDWAKTAE
jgi:uncharacterized protein YbjT (DUF2867 family)